MADQPTQPGAVPPGYPPQGQAPGGPYQPAAYPPPGYPPQAGYPQPGYSQGAYPPPPPGYPPAAGYPPMAGYPPYRPVGGAPMPGTPGAPIYAGFWIRFAAYIIDVLVLIGLFFLCLIIIVVGWIAMPFVLIGYQPWMWWKKGGTVGQRLLGLRVVNAADGGPVSGSQAVIRFLGKIASGAAFDLGYIWAAFEPRKRAWHDMIADTVVIRVD